MTGIPNLASVAAIRTRRNISPGYVELEPKIVKKWLNKG